MKTASIALVVIVLAFPGGAQNKSSEGVKQNGEHDHAYAEALQFPSIKEGEAKGKQKEGSGVTSAHPQERIIFPTPVPIKSSKDIWDKAIVLLTGALVFVAGVQIFMLWRTVLATASNAKATFCWEWRVTYFPTDPEPFGCWLECGPPERNLCT